MQIQTKKLAGLTGNQLKLLALFAMTCDHVGLQLLPQFILLRIIGRLAAPLFACMIAEGCRYTCKRGRYLGRLLGMAALCQIAYFAAMRSLYQCIFVTFSLSVCLIYALDNAVRRRTPVSVLSAATAVAAVVFVTEQTAIPLGEATVTVFPPVGQGDPNEQGLTYLCTSGDFDLLITGDMSGPTELALTQMYKLPDVEVLLVGHHGSKYSSQQEFLSKIEPDAAIISVGDNNYGHPTDAAISRLEAAGATVYRTDQQGCVTVTLHKQ